MASGENGEQPDAIEHHPARYDWRARFNDVRVLDKKEGGATYSATGEGAHWIVTDEGTMADFLPPDEHDGLIRLMRYDDREKWELAVTGIVAQARQRLEDPEWPSPWTYEEMQRDWQESFEERAAHKRRGGGMVKGLYLLHIDGGKKASTAGGTAPGAYGFVLRDPKGNDMPDAIHGRVLDEEVASPHAAEYEGLLAGLEFVHRQDLPYLAIFSDSRTVVNQVNGLWDASGELAEYRDKVRSSLDRLKGWQLSWIPRKWNKQADEQVRLAFEARDDGADVEHAD